MLLSGSRISSACWMRDCAGSLPASAAGTGTLPGVATIADMLSMALLRAVPVRKLRICAGSLEHMVNPSQIQGLNPHPKMMRGKTPASRPRPRHLRREAAQPRRRPLTSCSPATPCSSGTQATSASTDPSCRAMPGRTLSWTRPMRWAALHAAIACSICARTCRSRHGCRSLSYWCARGSALTLRLYHRLNMLRLCCWPAATMIQVRPGVCGRR